MTPGSDIHRATQRPRSIESRIHFHNHPVGNNALVDKLLGFGRRHFGDTLAFAVQNTAHVRKQDQIGPQRRRQRGCRLIGVDVHQLAALLRQWN